MADDIRELNALIADYGKEFQSSDPRRGPSLGSARLYNEDYQPATGSEQAEMVMSMLPGVGEGLDAAHFAKDIGDRNYLGAGLSGLGLVVPGLGAATIKKIAGATQKGSPVVSKFTTGRGSTYEQYNDGTTQRNRSGARHRDTSTGLQPRSNKTVFADKDSINSVGGIFQNTDMATRLDPVFDNDGNITEMSLNLLEDFGPRRAGESLASVPVTTRPEVGLYPVEIGNPESPMGSSGSGVHFGSEIISVDSATIKKIAGKDKTSEELLSLMYKDVKKKYPDAKVTEAEFLNNLKNMMGDGTVAKRREASLTDESIQKAQEKFTQNKAGADTLTPAQQARYIMELHRNAELPSVSVSKQGYITGSDDQPLTLYHMTHSKEPFDDFDFTVEERLPFLSTSTTPKGAEIGSSYAARKVLGETGSRTIPMKARATKVLDFENPGHLSELSKYMKENRTNTDTEFDDVLVDQMIDDMLQGNWAVLEKPRAREAMQKLGFDAFTTTEGGAKNVMLLDPTRQVEPLFDPKKTGMIGKYRRGGSVVERSNNYEPKAI
tara:strand:+ start:2676 stop:4322 length:1647 start_codon:yes stop_codon:yes gene_type:complete